MLGVSRRFTEVSASSDWLYVMLNWRSPPWNGEKLTVPLASVTGRGCVIVRDAPPARYRARNGVKEMVPSTRLATEDERARPPPVVTLAEWPKVPARVRFGCGWAVALKVSESNSVSCP